jgi:uncharacterized protein HemY
MSSKPLADTADLDLSDLQTTPTFAFTIRGERRELSYQEAFVLGYSLARHKHYHPAVAVFQRLAAAPDSSPRASIMLAHCLDELSEFDKAKGVLDNAFPKDHAVANELQDVFVCERLGAIDEALKDLVDLVNKHKELPTLCLLLGDLFEMRKRPDKARQCWKLAIHRDRPDGPVTMAARQRLAHAAGKSPPAPGPTPTA